MYLGGEIIVLYQGRIMERGSTQGVTGDPHHPYAQLLMSSVPVPDPNRRWKEDLAVAPLADVGTGSSLQRERCLFAERCPLVMDACWQTRPALRSLHGDDAESPGRDVSCVLYRDS